MTIVSSINHENNQQMIDNTVIFNNSDNNSLELKTETRNIIIIIRVNFFRVQVYLLLFGSTGKILLHACCMITLFIHYSLTIFTQTSFTK